MSDTVKNNSLDNFETNRDQDLGKAIAEAANALSKNIQIGNPAADLKISANDKITSIHQENR